MKKSEYGWNNSHKDNSFNYLINSLKKNTPSDKKVEKSFLDVRCSVDA